MSKVASASSEQGQSVVEYALVIGAVSVLLLGILAAASLGWVTGTVNSVTADLAALGIG